MNNYEKLLVEFLGTMLLVMSVIMSGNYLVVGATLSIIILLWKHISQGAFNPAKALAMAYAGIIPQEDLIPYIVVECLGAIVGYEIADNLIKFLK